MEIHLTAAGTPAEIMGTLARDIARERAAHPECAATLLGARDDIAKQIDAATTLKGEQSPSHFTVSAKIQIGIDQQANADDAERARKALVGGQPFTPTPVGSGSSAGFSGDKSLGTGVGDIDLAADRRRASDQARIDAANAGTTK